MFFLVSYDIPDNARRNRVSKTLLDFGTRVQYSVFECILDDALRAEMEGRLRRIIDEDEDSIRVYSVCAGCERKITVIGSGKVTKDEEVYIL
ncbi:MAG: CRISPR-associated endonuclease Cas2 [Deltaproteobacteria bacterium]|nr:CRISPR-associated endonuclease Cas2 [Deltaproteobacteria bacterium]